MRRIREPASALPTGVAIARSIGPNTSGRCIGSPVRSPSLRCRSQRWRSPVAVSSPVAGRHQFAKAATRSVISAGPTRQQPPINEAPAAVQARTSAAEKVGVPDQLLVAAFQVSPLFG